MLFLRTLCIVWNLVRRRVTRRYTRLQTMYNVLKYSKTKWENDDISIYQSRTGTGNKFNWIMRMTVHVQWKYFIQLAYPPYISDPRVRSWFLLSSPRPVLAITSLYLLFVWLGPKYMQSRQPFSLKPAIVVYNLGSVFLSIYMLYEVITHSFCQFICCLRYCLSSSVQLHVKPMLGVLYISLLSMNRLNSIKNAVFTHLLHILLPGYHTPRIYYEVIHQSVLPSIYMLYRSGN